MFSQQNNLRPVGVMTPAGQGRPTGAPKQLLNVAPVEWLAVSFTDANGTVHDVVVMKLGNTWYLPKNSEEWARGLQEVAPWLIKQVEAELAARTAHKKVAEAAVPKTDTVDVMEIPK